MPGQPQARDTEQLALLVDSVSDYAIFMLDASGHVATWNRGAQRIKGYRSDEIIGQPYEIFFTPEDRRRAHPAEALSTALREGRFEEEGWRVRSDGARFWANVVMTAVRDEDGEHLGFAKVTRDLTERRAAEDALQVAHDELRRNNEELDRFAIVAAHDLSEPLTTVNGFAALLVARHSDELSPRAQEFLSHIVSSTERMQQLIGTLLEYARAGTHVRPDEPIAVNEACVQVIGFLGAAIDHRTAQISVELGDEVRVLADRSDIEILLQNLIANAIKFGGRDGEAPRVEIRAERVGTGWRIDVSDNGIGIAPDDQVRIFGTFQRAPGATARAGTGLGLAICERIVRRLGGAIGVESIPGLGSRFWFTLPGAGGG